MTDIKTELERIRIKRGDLYDEIIVEEAADPKHPLHDKFEWDDSIAGHKYRLVQAQHMLRVVYKPQEIWPDDLRAFMAVRQNHSEKATYIPTAEAVANPISRELILRQMKRDWDTFARRYQNMAEFADLILAEAAVLSTPAKKRKATV